MKNSLGICGIILIVLARQLFPENDGLGSAILFLGASMCISVGFLVVQPVLDRIVAETSRVYYLHVYDEYMARQQETMKRIEEEMLKGKQ